MPASWCQALPVPDPDTDRESTYLWPACSLCQIIPLQIQWLRAYPTVQPMRLPILVWLTMSVLAGCETAQQRKAAENATVNKKAAEEITRVCALHGAEREAQLKKLKAASGLDLYCPSE